MTSFNLLPTITNNPIEPDKTRSDLVIDHYAVMKKGSPRENRRYPARGPAIPAVGSLRGSHKPSVPSYSEIETENMIHDPADYEIIIKAEITPGMDVLLNGTLIASAPENKQMVTGKNKKLTQPERARFCRGVIWWLMNDEICLKDKLSEIGYCAPAPVVIPAVPAMVPADICIESITGSPYPGPGLIVDGPQYDQEYYNDRRAIIENLIEEGSDESGYDILDQDLNPEPAAEIIRAFDQGPGIKQFPAGWINHLRLSIVEEAITA